MAYVSLLYTICFYATMNLEKMKFWFCDDIDESPVLWVSAPSAKLSIRPSNGMKFSLITFSSAALGLI